MRIAARVRAARAFANLDQADIAARIGRSSQTVKAMEKGGRDFAHEDLEAIAELCGVPLDFLLHGFQVVSAVDDSETRIIIEATRQIADEALARIDDHFDDLRGLLGATTGEVIAQRAVAPLTRRRRPEPVPDPEPEP